MNGIIFAQCHITLNTQGTGKGNTDDGYDYPNANAKNCSFGFDKFGHGAAACGGNAIACAWKEGESDGSDFLEKAKAAAERMKKNLTRYVTVL